MFQHDSSVSRRAAIGAIGLGGMGVAGAAHAGTRGIFGGVLQPSELGWNGETGEYVLPPLPYDYNALEPLMDEETMRLHHDKHHAGYVRGLNRALSALADIRDQRGDASLIKHWSRELAFHGCGHLNHVIYWEVMTAPGTGGEPTGALAEAITRDFGSFEQFAAHFKAASGAVEGSGWGWLAYEPVAGKLLVLQGEKHQNLAVTGTVPLLGIDVWEHAYYLKYKNARGAYVSAFMDLVNWNRVGEFFDRARG